MASPSQNNGVTLGALKPTSTWGDYNNLIFVVNQAISRMQTNTLVRVESCTNDGDTSPVGFVNVTPLVNQIDGQGNPTPHGMLTRLPYLRIQGGSDAFILDPKPGDIGMAAFASRDITKVKTTKQQANPGSFRSYDFSDGIYFGGMLNGTPTQYIRFSADGVEIVSPNTITIRAANIVLDGPVAQSGGDVTMAQKLTVTDDVMSGTISVQHHIHEYGTPPQPTTEPIP